MTVHGLGTAINRAINLALELQETASYALTCSVTTSTIQLVDDLEPVDDVREWCSEPLNVGHPSIIWTNSLSQ